MKEQIDTPRSTMSDEEMVKDYPRLAREYTLLHQDYREAIRKPLIITDVSQQRELLFAFIEHINTYLDSEDGFNIGIVDEFIANNCG